MYGLHSRVPNEEAVVMILCQDDMFVPPISCTFLNIVMRDVGKPPKLASGEQKDMVQGRVVKVAIRDALKMLIMVAIQDNVLRTPWLITITQNKESNLSNRGIWSLIAPPITTWIKVQGNVTLLHLRHGMHQLKGLLVILHPRMSVEEHVLQGLQCGRSQVGVACIVVVMSVSHIRVTDVKL